MEFPFAIGPRATITPALLDLVVQHYQLGSVLSVTDLGGTYNLNIALQTAEATFVARVYRPWVTYERLLAIQPLKNQLVDYQIPVILPLHTTTGQTLIEVEQRLVEVELFIPHEQGSESWPHVQQRFAFLGQLHSVLSQLGNVVAIPAPQVENYALPQTLLSWTANTKQRLAQHHDPRVPAALAICGTVESLLHEIALWWEQSSNDLPCQLIHGDYGLSNVLSAQGQIRAVVDWDFVAVHERVFELAYALFWMCERMEGATANYERAWQRVGEMVSLYQATNQRSLTEEEQQALPMEMARVPLYWIAEAAWLDDPMEAVLSRADQIAFASWLMQHRPVLVADR